MNRRVLGRGRIIIGIGALIVLVACVFPWGQTAGIGLPPQKTGAFDGFGIVVFIAAIALLSLIALPYAAGDQPIPLDRPLAFAICAGIGIAGFLLKIIQIIQQDVLGLPDRSLGLWLAGVGLAAVCWGVAELTVEQPAT
jgi:hypothetical protein